MRFTGWLELKAYEDVDGKVLHRVRNSINPHRTWVFIIVAAFALNPSPKFIACEL